MTTTPAPRRPGWRQAARLGAFEILRPIGAGGMGEVYQARDTRLDRMVAIKVLAPELAGDPAFRTRFEREAKAISALNHPHICRLHDIGRARPTSSIWCSNWSRARRWPHVWAVAGSPSSQMLGFGVQIADALEAAHRQGIIHRDLKPGNIMLTPAGTKLLDFGLAKKTMIGAAGQALTEVETGPATATAPGVDHRDAASTWRPNRCRASQPDVRTDIFALGTMLLRDGHGPTSVRGHDTGRY